MPLVFVLRYLSTNEAGTPQNRLDSALALESARLALCRGTEDNQPGIKSFVEKRKTRVQGPVIGVVPMSLDMPAKNEPVRYVELRERTNDNT